jgi:hypothetical protein
MKLLLAVALALAPGVLAAQTTATPGKPHPHAVQASPPALDPQRIRAHVRFLASDQLEGRGTGEPGGELAADYIAKQFASYGLQPAGDNGSYFQSIPLTEVTTLGETSFTLVSTGLETLALRNLEDFVASNPSQTVSAYIDAPIVFVGFGIAAAELGRDDYQGANLDGKVALLLAGEPSTDGAQPAARISPVDYGGWSYKFAEAARHGAIAALIVHRARPGEGWEVMRNSWGRKRAYLRADAAPKLRAAAWLQADAARKLLVLAGLDPDRLVDGARSTNFRPIELPLRLQAHVVSEVRPIVARNVLAVRRAAGSKSEEAVLYTAHYDSLGTDAVPPGHATYPGAVEDATGCGVLLELARAWAGTAALAARAIVFAALAAEQQGLLGSQYLAKHSPVPPGRITIALNFDALAPIGNTEEVVVSGAERTNFYSMVKVTAPTFGLAIGSDPPADALPYDGSSPFSLARAGMPAFSIAQGLKFKGHDAAWGEAQQRDYLEHRYLRPSDRYLPEMDFSGAARLARFAYGLGHAADAQYDLIEWLPGDSFEAARRHSETLAELTRKPPLRSGRRVK